MKRTLCGILMMFLVADAIAAAVIENIRVRKTPERTRVVLDASAPLEHKVFTLPATDQKPDRLVIDVPEAKLSFDTQAVDVGDGPILGLRTSQKSQSVRIVLDLEHLPFVSYYKTLIFPFRFLQQTLPVSYTHLTLPTKRIV